jgi:hypothetical protein
MRIAAHAIAVTTGVIGRAPVIATLIQTTRLNNIDPQAWLAELFGPHQRSRHPQDR